MQKFALRYYADRDRNRTINYAGEALKMLISSVNPFAAKAFAEETAEGEDESVHENVAYGSDVIRGDAAGEALGNEERMRLYKEHMEKIEKKDPTVRTVGTGGGTSFNDR